MRHSAVLLAGGKSTRMGSDKAQIITGGEPLWARQLSALRNTGPAEVFISGSMEGPWRGADCRIIPDAVPEQGPLGGIASVLPEISTDWLLVLAVDLPAMSSEFLRRLVEKASASATGIVPAHSNGELEPLAAVYPAAAARIASDQLRKGELKLARYIEVLEASGMIRRQPLAPEEFALFQNWNTPGDVKAEP